MILQGVSFTCRPGSILIDDLQLGFPKRGPSKKDVRSIKSLGWD